MTTPTEMFAAADEFAAEDRRIIAACALMRFDHLDTKSPRLSDADRFDYAYSIWDDYITDHHHDEQDVTFPERHEQAHVFSRLLPYLNSNELIGLATAAWGNNILNVATSAFQFCWSPDLTAAPLMLLTRQTAISECWVITSRGKHHSITNLSAELASTVETVPANNR